MTFKEKLSRLTEDMIKARISRRAGLPPNAINDYINKGHTPGAHNAVSLARALGVDVGWLIDDAREWPPVRVETPTPTREPVAA